MNFESCWADLLQEQHQDGDEGASLLLQSEETSRRSDKQLGVSVSDVVLETVLVDDHLYGLFVRRQQVVGPSVLARHFIPAGARKTTMVLISRQKEMELVPFVAELSLFQRASSSLTAAGSDCRAACRQSRPCAPSRSPAGRGRPPGAGSERRQTTSGTSPRWASRIAHSKAPEVRREKRDEAAGEGPGIRQQQHNIQQGRMQ